MARMIKNAVPRTASHAIGIPVGTSSIGPDSPVVGQARWNTSTSRLEYYNGTLWAATAHEGNVSVVKDSFSGTGSATEFGPMSYVYSAGQEANVLVFYGGVYQNPGVSYTFYGNTTVHFTSAPNAGTNNILILHNFNSTKAN